MDEKIESIMQVMMIILFAVLISGVGIMIYKKIDMKSIDTRLSKLEAVSDSTRTKQTELINAHNNLVSTYNRFIKKIITENSK